MRDRNTITYAQRIREMTDEELADCLLAMIVTYSHALGAGFDDRTDNTMVSIRYALIDQLRLPCDSGDSCE